MMSGTVPGREREYTGVSPQWLCSMYNPLIIYQSQVRQVEGTNSRQMYKLYVEQKQYQQDWLASSSRLS